MSAADSGSWATARMPRPIRERRTNWSSANIITSAEPNMSTSTSVTQYPPMLNSAFGSIVTGLE